jgi:NAD(P)-dependent dehydrogenase (short-subunit alcohol dehydrogenase family)
MGLQLKTLIIALLALTALCATSERSYSQDAEQKAILITGATTGIGRNLAETLAADGHFVYAGARKQSDMDALNAIDNIMAVRLDVTKQDEIDAAVELVRKEGRGLYGLINNAGVAVFAPMIEVDEGDMQFQMDVNMFGPYRVTKAFAPLIIESKGRISTTSSISGILSGSMAGPYSMSKHAIEAFTDSLAEEMRKFEVEVSAVEPGNYNSVIVDTMRRREKSLGRGFDDSLYKEEQIQLLEYPSDRSIFKEPDEVSAAFMHFLFDDNPKRRYMVVPNEGEAEVTIRKAISELAQLNERQEYTYSRDQLIKMLDEAMNPSEK